MGAEPLGDERLRVYLTNSLTGWLTDEAPTGLTLFPELAQELHDASVVKRREPVLVILGNPPYQGYSSAESDEEKSMMRPWIESLWPVWGLRKHRMNDLYVRFWRVSIEKIAEMTGRGVVSFITNRKWLGGRSYPSMRDAVSTSFQIVTVDDLHGAVDDSSHPGDQSVFSTATASGITRGTAIVTAVRTGVVHDGQSAAVRIRDFWGSSLSKRDQLTLLAGSEIDKGFRKVAVSASTRWRFVDDAAGDFAQVDEYLSFNRSGVQPVRDEAVLAFTRPEIEKRMRDYFDASLSNSEIMGRYPGFAVTRRGYDPVRTRASLLAHSTFHPERVVPLLYRPFDIRWMYWEPDFNLLHRPRSGLMPFWLATDNQSCLVLPQTPRRVGAFRPVASTAVASFACAEPDARVFPLIVATSVFHGIGGALSSSSSVEDIKTHVPSEWIGAARGIGESGDDFAIGRSVFYCLIAMMNAPKWLSIQSLDADDFPSVPLPSDIRMFKRAVEVGRSISALNDPLVDVPGITSGGIADAFSQTGIPDAHAGLVTLDFGSFGQSGGKRQGDSVLWNADSGWRHVSDAVWSFTACGHAVLPKWLSYRRNVGLTQDDRETFMMLCRRIAAIRALEDECDVLYAAAEAAPLQAT